MVILCDFPQFFVCLPEGMGTSPFCILDTTHAETGPQHLGAHHLEPLATFFRAYSFKPCLVGGFKHFFSIIMG